MALEIGDMVWEIVTRAAYSIAFNISEVYERFHFAENRNFCYYSHGSAYETKTAIHKAIKRNLLKEEELNLLQCKLEFYFKLINPYIKSIGRSNQSE